MGSLQMVRQLMLQPAECVTVNMVRQEEIETSQQVKYIHTTFIENLRQTALH